MFSNMLTLLIIILAWFLGVVLVAPIANRIGEAINSWLENHFPNIEE